MVIYQAYNKKTKAWVKFKSCADGKTKVLDVKQKEPRLPFKGIKLKSDVKRR